MGTNYDGSLTKALLADKWIVNGGYLEQGNCRIEVFSTHCTVQSLKHSTSLGMDPDPYNVLKFPIQGDLELQLGLISSFIANVNYQR